LPYTGRFDQSPIRAIEDTALPGATDDAGSVNPLGARVRYIAVEQGSSLVATQVGIRELLEAGVHFGHQTRRWNPKMRRFIHGERGGIYLIDLLKTERLLAQAQEFAGTLAHRGGTVLFVGTKKQARDGVKSIAEAAGQPYVNHRWLGGLLTNFQTISQRIKRLHDLERWEAEGQLALLPTRERMSAQADLAKLRANLGGVKHMQRPPDAIYIIDLKTEVIAVQEAKRLRIPIIGLVDTNCDPDGIDYVIPGNDDAIRACDVITAALGGVIQEGRGAFQEAEQQRLLRQQEEEARRQAEAQAAKQAADQAQRQAEAAVRAEQEAPQAAAAAAAEPASQSPQQPAGDPKVTAEGGHDRAGADAEVAAAVQAQGHPQPDPHVAPRAAADEESGDDGDGDSPKAAPPAEEPGVDPASTPETPVTDAVQAGAAETAGEAPANG
jgi:small subunit ribosomal protein S2